MTRLATVFGIAGALFVGFGTPAQAGEIQQDRKQIQDNHADMADDQSDAHRLSNIVELWHEARSTWRPRHRVGTLRL